MEEIFRKVESVEHCLTLFHSEGLLHPSGLGTTTISLLERVRNNLRAQGLGLEPNLLGRAISNAVMDRHLLGAVSIRLANSDTDFCGHIVQAETSRVKGDLSKAQFHYWSALELFPSHPGFLIQYGHCLKDQGLIADALPKYIDAYYFGASQKDVKQHALFVASSIGLFDDVSAIFKRQNVQPSHCQDALDWLLTSKDIYTLTNLLHGHDPSMSDVCRYMCKCINRRELVLALVEGADFIRTHRDTLRLLDEIGWSAK